MNCNFDKTHDKTHVKRYFGVDNLCNIILSKRNYQALKIGG
jgi:hypothetical protein